MGILHIELYLRPSSKALPPTFQLAAQGSSSGTLNPPLVRNCTISLPNLPQRRLYRSGSLTFTTGLPNALHIDLLAVHPVGPVLLYLRCLR